jgi:outer membrane protein
MRHLTPLSAGAKAAAAVGVFTFLALTLPASRPAFCQVAPPAPLALPTPLTLPQALALALRQQPQQYLARTQVTQAQGQKLQAQSQYFPVLTPSYQYQNTSNALYGVGSGGFTTITTPGAGTGGTTTTGTGTTTGTAGTTTVVQAPTNEVSIVRGGGLSVSLSQTLFDTGQREAANTEARRAVEAAEENNRGTRQTIILNVTQDYYQLLLNRDLVKVAQAQVARYQQTVDVTQAQIDAGTTAAKDIYQAKSDLANAQVTLLNNYNAVQTASATLKNAIGINLNGVVEIAPLTPGDQLPPVPSPGQSLSLDNAMTAAFAERPDVRQQQAVVQSDAAALRLARSQAGLSVKGDYVLNYQATNDVGTRGVNSQFLVSGSYPLFDAGLARGAVRIAQAARDGALDQLELVRQQVRLDVEQAYSTRQTNLDAAGLAQAAITAAQVNYDAVIASRKEGIGTVLDITTAQATLTQAQSQYVSAVYNFYIADAQLQRAIGRNDAALPPVR